MTQAAQPADRPDARPPAPLRILIVAGYFPPHAPSAATRAPQLARYWRARGHDVRVLSAANPGPPSVLEHDIPAANVLHIPYTRVDDARTMLAYRLAGRQPRPPGPPAPGEKPPGHIDAAALATARPGPLLRARNWLAHQYRQLLILPDHHVYWAAQALGPALGWCADWRPHFIYASSPPHSGQVLAARLASRLGTPWIGELRDEWAYNPYSQGTRLRAAIEGPMERATLSRAAGLVALTQGTRDRLARRYALPVVLAMNGYDPDEFAGLQEAAPFDPVKLTILHAGSIYVGKRDPSALFAAVARLGPRKHLVDMRFYGEAVQGLPVLAQHYGVADQLTISPPIPRRQVLALERQMDVLLICRWDDPLENAIIPGKLFEYLGARRPVLVIGSGAGEAADIVRSGPFGVVPGSIDALVDQLNHWLDEKQQCARLPDLPDGRAGGYTRAAQFDRLSAALGDWLAISL